MASDAQNMPYETRDCVVETHLSIVLSRTGVWLWLIYCESETIIYSTNALFIHWLLVVLPHALHLSSLCLSYSVQAGVIHTKVGLSTPLRLLSALRAFTLSHLVYRASGSAKPSFPPPNLNFMHQQTSAMYSFLLTWIRPHGPTIRRFRGNFKATKSLFCIYCTGWHPQNLEDRQC